MPNAPNISIPPSRVDIIIAGHIYFNSEPEEILHLTPETVNLSTALSTIAYNQRSEKPKIITHFAHI